MQNNFWCDFYHLTMAQTLFLDGQADVPSTFEMFIRQNPFDGGYTIAAGQGLVLQWLSNWGYASEKIAAIERMGMFQPEFLEFIRTQPLQVTIDALPEGEVFFPNEPIVRVSGPAWQVSIIETAFLNAINCHSMIATKAARIKNSAQDFAGYKDVMEFGYRRSQSAFGLISTRAAAIGGIIVTSNVDAAIEYGLPCKGTHAHSFVMHYDTELQAFEKWLYHNPNNATVLVDTYDTLQGVKNAILASKNTGVKLTGIRLDSGDLAYLSIEARKLLDKAGMQHTKIVASNDLDEYAIESLQSQGACIDVYGIGTKLVTPGALGGVYKVKSVNGVDRIKISGDAIKTTIPGATETIRIVDENGKFGGDVITPVGFITEDSGTLPKPVVSVNPENSMPKTFVTGTKFYKPMKRVAENGVVTSDTRPIVEIGRETTINLERLDRSHKRLLNPHAYVAGIEKGLFMRRMDMILNNKQH